jgi:membrane protease YdiL (CAAX protease family)
VALIAAVVIAPIAAMVLGVAGFRFPFPRIFDRAVMLTLFAALFVQARRLRVRELLRRGFSNPKTGIWYALSGLLLAIVAIAILFGLAAMAGADIHGPMIARLLGRYFPAAVLIAVLEEAFFRAFLLCGLEDQLGSLGALLTSSAIYAIVHVMRSPARFYVMDFEPLAGAENLTAYADRIIQPENARLLLGLFLLGLVLGEAFLLTRRAYTSLGVHAGFVLGAKTWRVAVGGAIPKWLAGPGSVPLVAAPAAWMLSAIMLTLLYLWLSEPLSEPEPLTHSSPAYRCAGNAAATTPQGPSEGSAPS